ncbi:MAG TPA: polyphosphate kinase 1 [Solirubrobacteraceae bacterium]|nr:polyphosphate kinase 1 [Solirubrobacteraceae bacterium]
MTTETDTETSEPHEQQPPRRTVDLASSDLYFNRELSWIDFNARVLELAEDDGVPLMERLKFAAIWESNLDEFFMIRVAGVHDQIDAGLDEPGADGRTPKQVLKAMRERLERLGHRHDRVLRDRLLPQLAEHGVRVVTCAELSDAQRDDLARRFARQIFPVLTPLGVGLGRPFPYISNLSLSLGVLLRDPQTGARSFARVKVPTEMLDRFTRVDDEGLVLVPLEEVIASNLDALFPGMEIVTYGYFRVTRDADFEISDEADDLLQAVETELRRRRFGEVVRVELAAGMDPELRRRIIEALDVDEIQVYEMDRLLDAGDLWQIVGLPGFGELRDPPWTPVTQPRLQGEDGEVKVLAAMRQGDILVHHPYDSFNTSVERFVEEAAADPDVLAIKLTIYRTSDDTPLVPALIKATDRGKQAVCLVELKARFDEQANITWARALEQSGVHVVYGHPSLKTHAKCVLVIRREGDGVRHYVHIGTGNYHPKTARLYTDFGLFTCDPQLGADVADMFNFLTGYSRPKASNKALLAPSHLRDGILREIEKTIAAHERGEPAHILMKMNSLVDRRCIRALYRASQAGVPVDLNIRGICCLRPGVEGVSDNIRVTSIVGRFLEHSRIFAFKRGDDTRVLIGSADLMPRNLDTRVELVAPIDDDELRADVLDVMDRALADDTNAWDMHVDGTWHRRVPGPEPRSVQRELMVGHAARAAESA